MEKLLPYSKDIYYTPIYMKKNRPAYKLSVLASKENEEKILDIIFRHTTSIGVRKYDVSRNILDRKIIDFESSFGRVKLKIAKYKEEKFIYPEYESIKNIANNKKLSINEIYSIIKLEYLNKIGG